MLSEDYAMTTICLIRGGALDQPLANHGKRSVQGGMSQEVPLMFWVAASMIFARDAFACSVKDVQSRQCQYLPPLGCDATFTTSACPRKFSSPVPYENGKVAGGAETLRGARRARRAAHDPHTPSHLSGQLFRERILWGA